MPEDKKNDLERWRVVTPILLVFLSILSTMNLTMMGWIRYDVSKAAEKVITIDNRVTAIESNRFTIKDWHIALDDLKNQLPPKWVKIMLEHHEKRISQIEHNNHKPYGGR